MARHAQDPPAARIAARRGDDGTTRGIVLPLLAAALVCLLATTGVLLFRGSGDDGPSPGPVGLNVPYDANATDTGPYTGPSTGPSASARPSGSASVSPSASASAGASASASRTATASPGRSASPQPPRTSAPAANPKEVQVQVSAKWPLGGGKLKVRNPSATHTYTWTLVLETKRGQISVSGFDATGRETGKNQYTITGRTALAPGASAEFWYSLGGRFELKKCTLNGAPCSLDLT